MGKVDLRAFANAGEQSRGPREGERIPADVGNFASPSRVTHAKVRAGTGQQAETGNIGRLGRAVEQPLQADADSQHRHRAPQRTMDSAAPGIVQPRCAAEMPDSGNDDARGALEL